MSPSKILIGQFLIVLSIIVSAMWSATQWVAHVLGYQLALGQAWLTWNGWPIYPPWQLFNKQCVDEMGICEKYRITG